MIGRWRSPRNIRVTGIDRLEDESWGELLASVAGGFRASHRAELGRAFESAFDSYTFAPTLVSYSDRTSAMFPLVTVARAVPGLTTMVGMPFSLEGSPVVLSGALAGAHIHALFGALDGCGRLDLTGGALGSPPAFGHCTTEATHVLDLRPGFDEIWKTSFSGKNRNMCRKAERAGIDVTCETGQVAVGEYYTLYERATAGWGYDAPPYPRPLFEALVASGVAELWLARLAGMPIAGALLLRGSGDLMYWSGAMDREHRNAAPSNAVIRAAIQSGCERGLGFFDFGSSGPLAGVQAFKEAFGAQERMYTASTFRTQRFRVGDAAIRSIRSARGKRT